MVFSVLFIGIGLSVLVHRLILGSAGILSQSTGITKPFWEIITDYECVVNRKGFSKKTFRGRCGMNNSV